MTEELDNFIELDFKATAGSVLEKGVKKASKEEIIAAVKSVQDPELMINIYDLGLIYDINQKENGDVDIVMTLTSPMCPLAGDMPKMVANAVSSVPGTGIITVELTFDPPWGLDKLSEEIKLSMGL
ncbi:MAG: iron-sulfur cluster assembly protein [Alphaproteobacteria bacterium]